MLAYVDDNVVTSAIRKNHAANLAETFANLRAANLSLNPKKRIFGVHKRKVLGCLVSAKGIEANLDKIKALLNMEEPQSVGDVQKLTGRITTLNRKSAGQSRDDQEILDWTKCRDTVGSGELCTGFIY